VVSLKLYEKLENGEHGIRKKSVSETMQFLYFLKPIIKNHVGGVFIDNIEKIWSHAYTDESIFDAEIRKYRGEKISWNKIEIISFVLRQVKEIRFCNSKVFKGRTYVKFNYGEVEEFDEVKEMVWKSCELFV